MSGTSRPPADPNLYFGQPIVPVATILITLSTLFVGMRFWSRTVVLRAFGVEDVFILLGWVCASSQQVPPPLPELTVPPAFCDWHPHYPPRP